MFISGVGYDFDPESPLYETRESIRPRVPVLRIDTTATSYKYPFHIQGLTRALVAYNMEFLLQVRNRATVNDAAQRNPED